MPLEILFVQFPSDLYGAGRSLVRLAERLQPHGHTVHVLLSRDGPLKSTLEARGAVVHCQPSMGVVERSSVSIRGLASMLWNAILATIRTARLIRSFKIDIVHSNSGIIFSGAVAAWIARVPHIWHIRDWFGEFPYLWKYYSRFILRASAGVICVSNPIAEQFLHRERVHVIHDGFDLSEFTLDSHAMRQQLRSRYELGDGLVVGTVGRIKMVRKGQDTFIRAAALLKRKGVAAKYLIVGAPYPGNESHFESLVQLVKELKLTEDVVFTGELPDARPAYAAMDIFVLPSGQPEPFGGVVMEAMAMERPVIATAIGGSLEQVVEGVTGFLVAPSDPAGLARSLEILAGDRDLRAAMGKAGRARMAEEFRLDTMVQKIESLYSSILNRSSASLATHESRAKNED